MNLSSPYRKNQLALSSYTWQGNEAQRKAHFLLPKKNRMRMRVVGVR
jgi:hypothetical protein